MKISAGRGRTRFVGAASSWRPARANAALAKPGYSRCYRKPFQCPGDPLCMVAFENSAQISMSASDEGSHLLFVVQGVWDVDAVLRAARHIAAMAEATPHRKALIDLTGMTGTLTLAERYLMGASLGRIFAATQKVGVAQITDDKNGYAAKVATQRGAKMAVFSHIDDARLWLLSEL